MSSNEENFAEKDTAAMNGELTDNETDAENVINRNADAATTRTTTSKTNGTGNERKQDADAPKDMVYEFNDTSPKTQRRENAKKKSPTKAFKHKKIKLEPVESSHGGDEALTEDGTHEAARAPQSPEKAASGRRKRAMAESTSQSSKPPSPSLSPPPKKGRPRSSGNDNDAAAQKSQASSARTPTASRKRPHSSFAQLKIPQVVQETTALASGDNEVGQLGLEQVEVKRFRPVSAMPEKIVTCAAGGMHSLFLSDQGHVFSFGCNDDGSLGRPTEKEEDNFTPGIVHFDTEVKIAKVAAGSIHSVALTTDGEVFIWGNYRDNSGAFGISPNNAGFMTLPMKLSLPGNIMDIACGADHTLMLDAEGNIYSMGCAEHGKLGRIRKSHCGRENRRARQVMLTPRLMRVVQKRKLVMFDRVWAGRFCSFARSGSDGVIWGCGLNNCHQLGTVDPADHEDNFVFHPVELRAFALGKEWTQICGGEQHTLALDSEGTVYAMGRVLYGRLGLGPARPEEPDVVQLTPVSGLERRVVAIAAGDHCSFALDNEGQLWCWGQGSNMLGQGDRDSADETDIFVPTRCTSKTLKDKKVIHIDAGANHTLCVARD